MKVRELIEKLSQLDPEADVCIKGHEYCDEHLDLGSVELIDEDRKSSFSEDMIRFRFVSLSA